MSSWRNVRFFRSFGVQLSVAVSFSDVPTVKSTSTSSPSSTSRAAACPANPMTPSDERVVLGEDALAARRGRDARGQQLGERAQVLLGPGDADAGTGEEHRVLRAHADASRRARRRRDRTCASRGDRSWGRTTPRRAGCSQRSTGTLRWTGPGRPVSAWRSARRRCCAMLSGDVTIAEYFVTGRNIATMSMSSRDVSCAAPLPNMCARDLPGHDEHRHAVRERARDARDHVGRAGPRRAGAHGEPAARRARSRRP